MGDIYGFIDGGYLHSRYGAFARAYFADEPLPGRPRLDYHSMRYSLGVQKVFYYDSLDDVQRQGETAEDSARRVEAQEDEFARIRSLPSFHVRLGSVSGTHKKIRQKQVDVLLAVEAMHHAFQKNMTHAVLLAGDLDFKPVVDLLVQYGVFVTVKYDRGGAASGLYWAADNSDPIRPLDYYNWSPRDVLGRQQTRFPRPEHRGAYSFQQELGQIEAGPTRFQLYASNGKFVAADLSSSPVLDASQVIACADRALLEQYLRDAYA